MIATQPFASMPPQVLKFFDKGLSLCSKIAFEERPYFY